KNGGDVWGSNPPGPAVPTPTGFEARGTHQSTLVSDSHNILGLKGLNVHDITELSGNNLFLNCLTACAFSVKIFRVRWG
ncbi:hypothetical protein KO465_07610, partial [Candidatus Micrarchaeota archaeon]|nr:hypothetical protein [Candidatus Micrarchaeota archaeon]